MNRTFLILLTTHHFIFLHGVIMAENPFQEGEITLRIKRSKQEFTLRQQYWNGQLRIEKPGNRIPSPPINLIDIKSGVIRILHPHNSTWQEMVAADLTLSPTRGPMLTGNPLPMPPAMATTNNTTTRTSDALRPTRPFEQSLPDLPSGIGPQPGHGFTAFPGQSFPPLGMFPSVERTHTIELKETEETRSIHHYHCVKHTVSIPREGEMTLWLAKSGVFPAFHLLRSDIPRQGRLGEWQAELLDLLRKHDRFPLLAVLVNEKPEREIVRWEVTHIKPGKVSDPEGTLFKVPVGFHRIEHH